MLGSVPETVFSEAQAVSLTWYPAISFVGTFVIGYLVSLANPRPTDERLRGLTIWTPSGEQRMEWVTES